METRLDEKHNFSKKNSEKSRKNTKMQEKTENYKKYRNETNQDFGGTRFPQDKISGNAENGNENKNKVFSNVRKRQFESKDKVSVQV